MCAHIVVYLKKARVMTYTVAHITRARAQTHNKLIQNNAYTGLCACAITVYGLVGSCLTAVHGVTLLFDTIALLLSLCVSRLKNLQYLTVLLLLLQ